MPEEGDIERRASFSVTCSGVLWTFVITNTNHMPRALPARHLPRSAKQVLLFQSLANGRQGCLPGLCVHGQGLHFFLLGIPISLSFPSLLGSKETLFPVGCEARTTERTKQRWEEVRSIVPQGTRKVMCDWSGMLRNPGDGASEEMQGAPEYVQGLGRAAVDWPQSSRMDTWVF